MPAYAIANLSNVDLNDEVARYIATIDETLVPFEGRFLVHGKTPDVLEGEWADTTVIIAFPDRERAYGWYRSPAYQEILPLRTENSDGAAIIVEGVADDYRAASFLQR
jgi:uncharacterized protein (DUF1330 family)